MNHYALMAVTFFFAFVLSILPLPLGLSSWRPEWSVMVLIFWLIRARPAVGVLFSWVVGLFMDVLEGAILGENALAFAIVAYLVISMHQRIKMLPLIQQSAVVFMLVGINLMVTHLINNLTAIPVSGFGYLKPAMTSAILWPMLYAVIQRLQLKYQ